jgi:tRNA pseudouridine55 synthase
MDGVLVIDKPAGMTYHAVGDEIRRRLNTKKVGHGGTLDPDATGVLVLGIGRATRFLSFAQASPKRYEGVVRFGSATSTQDASGELLATFDASRLMRADVEDALRSFEGAIEQTPPMVSAVKVGGEALYKKARRGEEVPRQPRRVTIHHATITGFASGDEPEAALDVRCSGGTYIRTLAHDLGAQLGCGAHLRSLRRTEAGSFTLADATPLVDVDEGSLRPLVDVVRDLPQLEVDADAAALITNGRPLDLDAEVEEGGIVALIRQGSLLALYRKQEDRLVAERVVSA